MQLKKAITNIFTFFIIINFWCPLSAQVNKGINYVDSRGLKQGKWVLFPDSITYYGIPPYKIKNNVKEFIRDDKCFITDSISNKFKVIANYKNDTLNGAYQIYFNDTILFMDGFYLNGKEDGQFLYYNCSHILTDVFHFKYGKYHGKYLSYISGLIISEYDFYNGIVLKRTDYGRNLLLKYAYIQCIYNYNIKGEIKNGTYYIRDEYNDIINVLIYRNKKLHRIYFISSTEDEYHIGQIVYYDKYQHIVDIKKGLQKKYKWYWKK